MTLALVERADERLSALERLEVLCDPGSLQLVRTQVRSRRMGEKARDGDGILGASGRVDGRPIFCFAQDPSFAGGSLGQAHADTVVRVLRLAQRARVPVIGLHRVRRRAHAGGPRGPVRLRAHLPRARRAVRARPADLRDLRRVGRRRLLRAGAHRLRDHERPREHVPDRPRRGRRGHGRGRRPPSSSAARACTSAPASATSLRRDRGRRRAAGARPARLPPAELRRRAAALAARFAAGRDAPDAPVPALNRKRLRRPRRRPRRSSTAAACSRSSPRWARNVVCAFARIDGRAGRHRRQPAQATSAACSTPRPRRRPRASCARATCSASPLVVLVDTPGFLPGHQAGAVGRDPPRRRSSSTRSPRRRVPRVTVILRKAFGGAFIAMNAKELGADLVFAWPDAEIGVMGSEQAAGIIHRREIAAADDPKAERERLGRSYAREHLDRRRGRRRRARRRDHQPQRDARAHRQGARQHGDRDPADSPGGEPAAVNFSAPFEQLAEGDSFVSRGRTVTEADVVAFAALTGDWHPQHADADWAARQRVRRAHRPRDADRQLRRRAGAVRPRPRRGAAPHRRRRLQAAGALRRHDPRRGLGRRAARHRRRRRPRRLGLEGRQPGRPARLPRARRRALAPRRRRARRPARPTADGFVPIPL